LRVKFYRHLRVFMRILCGISAAFMMMHVTAPVTTRRNDLT